MSSMISGGLSAAEAVAEVEAETQAEIAVEAVKPHRLWLAPSQENLRELLVAAAERALEDPECAEVLYGRLNEYRTENEETAFTILCMRDPRYTFNVVFNASDLQPSETEETTVSNTEDLERLRQLLGDIPASVRSGISDDTAEQEPEEPEDTTPPVLF
ncbi:MAG: hypothetical protein WD071_16230 [Pseudohongiella sp.]|uniref:hypothetical protein n=1 Tax=Pseudohongiella sp. TaxID=1979412 RepID=UPI0034A04CB9